MKKTTKTIKQTQFWTKEEIKLLLELWDSQTIEQMCETLRRNRAQVMGMAREIRKAGYELSVKKKKGEKQKLVKEVLRELELI